MKETRYLDHIDRIKRPEAGAQILRQAATSAWFYPRSL